MKKINAIIRATRLQAVTNALHMIPEVTGMTTSTVRGYGCHSWQTSTSERKYSPLLKNAPGSDLIKLEPHTKIEIVCIDAVVEEVIDSIQKAARTGKAGDGKIIISPIDDIIRIQTGVRGEAAIINQEINSNHE